MNMAGENGVFNFEGGCYAKTINLDPNQEPDIYNAIKPGALLENVVFDENSREVDYSDGSKTENTRVSYPIDYIKNSVFAQGRPSLSGHPEKLFSSYMRCLWSFTSSSKVRSKSTISFYNRLHCKSSRN